MALGRVLAVGGEPKVLAGFEQKLRELRDFLASKSLSGLFVDDSELQIRGFWVLAPLNEFDQCAVASRE